MKKLPVKTAGAIAFLLAPAVGFLFRFLSYWALGALYRAWNLTSATLPYAPMWAKSLVSVTDAISACFFLAGVWAVLGIFRKKHPGAKAKKLWLYPLAGALLSVFTVGLFLLTGSARMTESRTHYHIVQAITLLLMDCLAPAAYAWFLRRTPDQALGGRLPVFRFLLSALGQAGIFVLAEGFSPVSFVNALLLGVCLFVLSEKTKSVLPEIGIVSVFRLFTRFVFGYPDLGGAYPVSEGWLTGADQGVAHSLLLTFYLILAIAVYIARTKRAEGGRHV